MTWDSTYEAPEIKVCGNTYEIDAGAPFAETVKDYAREAGFSKFRVFVNEAGVTTEIDSDNAPETIKEGVTIEIKPYEKAAQSGVS